jgi:hypothetical protein
MQEIACNTLNKADVDGSGALSPDEYAFNSNYYNRICVLTLELQQVRGDVLQGDGQQRGDAAAAVHAHRRKLRRWGADCASRICFL